MSESLKILIVDDEPDILEILAYNLKNEGFKVSLANNGHEALDSLKEEIPHVIILDIMMPGLSGIEVCKQIRANADYSNVLICFLTASSESVTHISALDSGGDDFIAKPIKPKVLISRVKALIRRHPQFSKGFGSSVQKFGDLEIDYDKYIVKLSESTVSFAKKEFELLKLLTSKPGTVFTRQEILKGVWGFDVLVGDRTIDVHVRKLREKLGSHYIQTIKGVGYKFDF